MNLHPPAPHINRHILETLYNSGAPQICTLADFGPDSAFEVFQALWYMQDKGWVEKTFHGRFYFRLTDYGAHLAQLGLVIENAGAVDDDPGDVSTHFLKFADSAPAHHGALDARRGSRRRKVGRQQAGG